MVAMEILLVLVKAVWNVIINVIVVRQFVMADVLDVQVAQIVQVLKVVVVVVNVMHHAIIVAIVFIVVIAQAVIVAIFVQTVKLATHNAIQIISDYFYALLYCFLQLILIHINYLLIV